MTALILVWRGDPSPLWHITLKQKLNENLFSKKNTLITNIRFIESLHSAVLVSHGVFTKNHARTLKPSLVVSSRWNLTQGQCWSFVYKPVEPQSNGSHCLKKCWPCNLLDWDLLSNCWSFGAAVNFRVEDVSGFVNRLLDPDPDCDLCTKNLTFETKGGAESLVRHTVLNHVAHQHWNCAGEQRFTAPMVFGTESVNTPLLHYASTNLRTSVSPDLHNVLQTSVAARNNSKWIKNLYAKDNRNYYTVIQYLHHYNNYIIWNIERIFRYLDYIVKFCQVDEMWTFRMNDLKESSPKQIKPNKFGHSFRKNNELHKITKALVCIYSSLCAAVAELHYWMT